MKVETGDYIVGTDIYRVIGINGWTSISYNLLCLTMKSTTIKYYEPKLGKYTTYTIEPTIKSATRGYLRHLGKLVKAKDAKVLKLLYG